MKKLKVLLMVVVPVLLVAGLITVPAHSQAPSGTPIFDALAGWRTCMAQAFDAAGVTDAQKSAMQAIRQKYAALLKELRESNLPPEQKRLEARKLAQAARTELNAVLSPGQWRIIRQYVQQNCPGERPGIRPGIGNPPFQCLEQALDAVNIDPDRKALIMTIRQVLASQLQALRESQMPPEQKRQEAQRLMTEAREDIEEILSDEEIGMIRAWVVENCRRPGAVKPPAPGPRPGLR